MKNISQLAEQYHQRFGYNTSAPKIAAPAAVPRLIIVIPSYDEEPEESLRSLGSCNFSSGEAEVLLVFNHSSEAPERVKAKHLEQLEKYQNYQLANGLQVYSLAAFDLPPRHAGVGLARKAGMDTALQRFGKAGKDGLIVCFDADSEVSPNYLQELLKAEEEGVRGLSIYFKHPLEGLSEVEVERIAHYEIWLRYYVQALRYAHYPNAFHTIGSSMAVRASAYAKIGGMNRRKAGEDFYFLHKLIPHGGFRDVTSCAVYPSSRSSTRVPFGTGRAMLEMEAGSKDFKTLYHPQIFRDLKAFHDLGEDMFQLQLEDWPQSVAAYFETEKLVPQIEKLRQRSGSQEQLLRNFSFWWDGFKLLKYVHFARDNFYAEMEYLQASNELFGFEAESLEDLLAQYRALDKAPAYGYI